MNELFFILIVIIWYALSLYLSETKGKTFKYDLQWLFFISMVFSPLVAVIAIVVFNNAETGLKTKT
ncbi:MAG: hypothetical protein B6I20_09065 [Bacteroidetes bacterium 4572_117]|nr:MAG: hypothetical protein B6I20_09065 [Bacteroidetes bacterium 4572_117]